jgi:hypothetical protein
MASSVENVMFKVTIEVVKETGWSDRPILAKAVVEDGGLIEHPDVMAGKLAEIISTASERVQRQLRQAVAIKKREEQLRIEIAKEAP